MDSESGYRKKIFMNGAVPVILLDDEVADESSKDDCKGAHTTPETFPKMHNLLPVTPSSRLSNVSKVVTSC